MYGVVTVQRAKAKSAGGFEILPFETSLKLINGKATITEAETDGTGPFYDSVYLFRVQNGYCGHRYGFMAALPDGTTPITTGELPMVDPITGEGIYMDAQEWNALYGELPSRVSSLETGKANTSHTHAIGDVTGLQTTLNTKGNATMRIDTTAGTRVFITDGTTERMVSGDTGWRDLTASFSSLGNDPKLTALTIKVRRVGELVYLETIIMSADNTFPATTTVMSNISGFRSPGNYDWSAGYYGNTAIVVGTLSTSAFIKAHLVPNSALGAGLRFITRWVTNDPWPTTLPGNPA